MAGPSKNLLRIVSWNIRAGGGRRAALITEQIEAWRADVVSFSEFRATAPSSQIKKSLERQGLRFQVSTADAAVPAANRLLIASRWPLSVIRTRKRPEDAGRWCLVGIAAPRPFAFGAMHVPNRVSGRKYPFHEAVLSLARSWRRGPAILVGDTNSGRIGLDEEAPAFNKREDGWMLALEDAGWSDGFRHLHGDTRAYTWYSPNGRNGFRIDQAFINPHLMPRLIDTRYEWSLLPDGDGRPDRVSDHAAIIVDVEA